MLSLERPLTVDGLTVFRDHADPNQFWYLPGPVALARRPGGEQAFSLIKYRPAVADGGVKGGGFAMIETTLQLEDRLRSRILATVLGQPGVTTPVLAAVPFEQGTVQCIALNLQGGGGAAAKAAPAGAFNAVEEILGTSVPSMDSSNRAAFNLVLSQEGATILEQAFTKGLAPVGVIYDLTYTALRPAVNVEITADYERIYQSFSASLEGQYMFFRAGIDAAFEKLKQDGAIDIKVINFTGEEDEKQQETWALNFFKDEILATWFAPTLTPGAITGGAADADPLKDVVDFGKTLLGQDKPAEKPATPGATTPGTASPGTTTPGATTPAATSPGASTTAPATPSPAFQPATLTPPPSGLPSGRAVTYTPATSGTRETITVTGAGAVVKVEGAATALNANGQFSVDVTGGQQKRIEVTWPATTKEEIFHLFFDFDKPAAAGWASNPPSAAYRAYVAGGAFPAGQDDARFKTASGVSDGTPAGTVRPWTPATVQGADRLTAWLNTLATPKVVQVHGHASYEQSPQAGTGHAILPEPERRDYNMRLSMRRSDVAVGIVGRAGVTLSTPAQSHGDADARGEPTNPATGDANDRVAKITGRVADAAASTYSGVLARPGSTDPGRPTEPTKPTDPKPTEPTKPSTPSTPNTPAAASLKLKFVHQEERKKVTFRYNRTEAVKRTYAPQGFVGLLIDDLDKSKHFLEVDLNDDFFRKLEISAEAQLDFARIGLTSAQAAIDYGKPSDADHVHKDFVFRPGDTGPKAFSAFLNAKHETEYTVVKEFSFDPGSGWEGAESNYSFPAERTADRALVVSPYDQLDFLEISIVPGDMDAAVLDSSEVRIEIRGPGRFRRRKAVTLTPTSAAAVWKVRVPRSSDADPRRIAFSARHRLKDGTIRDAAEVETPAGDIVVHDPFPEALDIVFIPTFDATQMRQAFIDVEYEDPANSYRRVERLEAAANQTENLRLRMALMDPRQRKFRYRFTFVSAGGLQQGPFIEAEETLIEWKP